MYFLYVLNRMLRGWNSPLKKVDFFLSDWISSKLWKIEKNVLNKNWMVARVLHNYNKKIYLFIAPTSINSHMHLTTFKNFLISIIIKLKSILRWKQQPVIKSYSANAFLEYEWKTPLYTCSMSIHLWYLQRVGDRRKLSGGREYSTPWTFCWSL